MHFISRDPKCFFLCVSLTRTFFISLIILAFFSLSNWKLRASVIISSVSRKHSPRCILSLFFFWYVLIFFFSMKAMQSNKTYRWWIYCGIFDYWLCQNELNISLLMISQCVNNLDLCFFSQYNTTNVYIARLLVDLIERIHMPIELLLTTRACWLSVTQESWSHNRTRRECIFIYVVVAFL